MVDVTPLFDSTSLSTPKAPPPRLAPSQSPQDALGAALLAGILTDLAMLKEQMRQQGAINRASNDVAAAQQGFNQSVAEAGRHQVDVNAAQAETNLTQSGLNAEVVQLIERHNKFVELVTAALGALDERLSALEERTIAPEPEPTAHRKPRNAGRVRA
jgi:hypothetical protein